jgi:hypothetical protein
MAGQEKKFVVAEAKDGRIIRGVVVSHTEAQEIEIREFGTDCDSSLVKAIHFHDVHDTDANLTAEERVFAEGVRAELTKQFLRSLRFTKIASQH